MPGARPSIRLIPRGGAYVERVIAQLQQDLSEGAVGCKIRKNIGMETRTPAGDYLMVDDPVFAPIFELLERLDCPVLRPRSASLWLLVRSRACAPP